MFLSFGSEYHSCTFGDNEESSRTEDFPCVSVSVSSGRIPAQEDFPILNVFWCHFRVSFGNSAIILDGVIWVTKRALEYNGPCKFDPQTTLPIL